MDGTLEQKRTAPINYMAAPVYRALGLPLVPFQANARETASQLRRVLELCQSGRPVVVAHKPEEAGFAAYLTALVSRRLGCPAHFYGLLATSQHARSSPAAFSFLWGAERFGDLEEWREPAVLVLCDEYGDCDLRLGIEQPPDARNHLRNIRTALEYGSDHERAALLCSASGSALPPGLFRSSELFVEVLDREDRPTGWLQVAGGYALARKAVMDFYADRHDHLTADYAHAKLLLTLLRRCS